MTTKNQKPAELKQQLPKPSKRQTRVRLVRSISDKVREGNRFQGDLSTQVEEAITKINLEKVKLIDFRAEGGTADDTTVSLDPKLYDKWYKAQRRRGASMNVLVNSALAAFLKMDVRLLSDDLTEDVDEAVTSRASKTK